MKKIAILTAAVVAIAFSSLVTGHASLVTSEMSYVDQSDLKGKIPDRDLISALDDNGDGSIDTDVWAQIQVDVQTYIDGTLGQRYVVPFVDPLPPVIKLAAVQLALEQIYSRRTMADEKAPFVLQANAQRSKLAAIAAGSQPLTPDTHRAKPTGVVITDSAKTQPRSGRPNI
jgi:phage gp36-like protein